MKNKGASSTRTTTPGQRFFAAYEKFDCTYQAYRAVMKNPNVIRIIDETKRNMDEKLEEMTKIIQDVDNFIENEIAPPPSAPPISTRVVMEAILQFLQTHHLGLTRQSLVGTHLKNLGYDKSQRKAAFKMAVKEKKIGVSPPEALGNAICWLL